MATARSRIAYVLRMYPQFSETFIVNEILELERRGQPIHIYSYRKPDGGRFHANLARVHASVMYVPESLHANLAPLTLAHRALWLDSPDRYLHALRFVLTHVAHGGVYLVRCFLIAGYLAYDAVERCDIGHLHAHFAHGATSVAMLASMLSGLPYSCTAHARDIYADFVDRKLLREKIARAQFVVTVSDYNAAFLRVLCPAHAHKLRRLYNGVDCALFTRHSHAPQPNLILGVGRLIEKKGFSYLVEACHILKGRGLQFRCEIVGEGELWGALQSQIEQLGVQDCVRLIGALPQDELVERYRAASVVALPCVVGSDGNRDALPTVLLEAMACGVPVVSTDVTGVPEIIDHGQNGFIVPQDDAPALADALETLLRDERQQQAFGRAARAKAERVFNLRNNVARLHELFQESLQSALTANRVGSCAHEHRLPFH